MEISQMKTKFLDGNKSIINENDPTQNMPTITVTSKQKKGGNEGLKRLVSCVDGQEYVSPSIEVYQEKLSMSAVDWFNDQKKIMEKGNYNFITACQLQGQIKTIQKRNK